MPDGSICPCRDKFSCSAKANGISPSGMFDLKSKYNMGYVNAPDSYLSSSSSGLNASQRTFAREMISSRKSG